MTRGEFEEVALIQSGKRCGVQWTPWMGDWFTSWSPRNDNSHSEGYWDHWIDLAIQILQDPLTALVRPEAHELAKSMVDLDLYSESARQLTEEELNARFAEKDESNAADAEE